MIEASASSMLARTNGEALRVKLDLTLGIREQIRSVTRPMLERRFHLGVVPNRMYCKRGRRLVEAAPTYPERDIPQADERRNFDQRADDTDEHLSRVQAKDRYRYGNRQLEVVPGSGKRERGGLCVVRA
jgi:hypothetical protein